MLELYLEGQFKRDLKLAKKRHKDLDKMWAVIDLLLKNKTPPPKHRPHKLSGEWSPYRECHIEPDWLLIYLVADHRLILVRNGTHAYLFN